MDSGYESPFYTSRQTPDFQHSIPEGFEIPTDSPCPASFDEMRQLTVVANYGAHLSTTTNSQIPYYPIQEMIPVEYVGSTSLDDRDRRRRKSIKSSENLTSMNLRRRAQNRASQRAFRERKEKHVQTLENQLQCLHEQHQELLQSYTRQSKEVQRLNSRIDELVGELNTLKLVNDMAFSELGSPGGSEGFDIMPYTSTSYVGLEHTFVTSPSQN